VKIVPAIAALLSPMMSTPPPPTALVPAMSSQLAKRDHNWEHKLKFATLLLLLISSSSSSLVFMAPKTTTALLPACWILLPH
jgi:hypothetical protein